MFSATNRYGDFIEAINEAGIGPALEALMMAVTKAMVEADDAGCHAEATALHLSLGALQEAQDLLPPWE